MAHANSILDSEGAGAANAGGAKADADLADKALIDRLDEYYEDPELVKGMLITSGEMEP